MYRAFGATVDGETPDPPAHAEHNASAIKAPARFAKPLGFTKLPLSEVDTTALLFRAAKMRGKKQIHQATSGASSDRAFRSRSSTSVPPPIRLKDFFPPNAYFFSHLGLAN
jgi:hypothetical protein